MKNLVSRISSIVINVDDDVYLSHIRNNVAFTVKVPINANASETIEKWLCMHMSEDDHAYEKMVKALNGMLHLNMPIVYAHSRKRTYKTSYFIDDHEIHTNSYADDEFDSTSMGFKLIVGDVDSIAIRNDEYRIVVKSNMDMEVYEDTTDQLIFRFPMYTVNPNELAVLKLFKDDCILLLRKFSNLALQLRAKKITDHAKRSILIDAARCNFNEDSLKKLAKVFFKYDKLALMQTSHNNPVVGLLPNTLWVYYGIDRISMWAYGDNGSEIDHIVIKSEPKSYIKELIDPLWRAIKAPSRA